VKKDQDVVLLMVAPEELDEPGHQGPCCFSHSISSARLCGLCKSAPISVERVDIADDRAGEPPYGDAADAIGAFGILVLPGDVVLGAAREHVHVMADREAFGDEPAQVL
jgi:hypothetical protein